MIVSKADILEARTTPDASDAHWLLISDVDDTLTGDDAALRELADALAAHAPRVTVALNSSRPWASVARTVDDVFPENFPFAATITAMGTQVRLGNPDGRDGDDDPAWEGLLFPGNSYFADWPRERIVETITALGHTPHTDEYQTPFKASFAVPADAQPAVLAALDDAKLPVRVIASGTDDFDVLAPGGGKDHATRYLHQALEQKSDLPPGGLNLVVAGDSANDLAMFKIAPRAIAVGNARAELLDAMPRDTSYHAKANHAAGVLEGLRHFGALPG